jgi:hypothetical protein
VSFLSLTTLEIHFEEGIMVSRCKLKGFNARAERERQRLENMSCPPKPSLSCGAYRFIIDALVTEIRELIFSFGIQNVFV